MSDALDELVESVLRSGGGGEEPFVVAAGGEARLERELSAWADSPQAGAVREVLAAHLVLNHLRGCTGVAAMLARVLKAHARESRASLRSSTSVAKERPGAPALPSANVDKLWG